eukprot:SAG22_NODE_162_length_16848_cov_16.978267_14_plen_37_part_00
MIYMKIQQKYSILYGKATNISWSNQPSMGFPEPLSD